MNERNASAVWQDASNILAVRVDAIGDVIMTSPALRAMKESIAGVKITLMTSQVGSLAVRHIPEIDESLVMPMPWVKEFPADRGPKQVLASIDELRSREFDGCVVFGNYDQNPAPAIMVAYLAGIPMRLAHSPAWLWHLLTDWARDPEPNEIVRHAVRRELDLVRHIGCETQDERLSFSLASGDETDARRVQEAHGVDIDRPWIVVHPGVSEEIRRYPEQGFIEVISKLAGRTGYQILLTGSSNEAGLCTRIASQWNGSVSLAGELSLGAFGAVIKGAALVITNNTATSHIAAAVQTPVVVLYARTNPQHQPWQVTSHVLYFDYEPCVGVCAHAHCLERSTERRSVRPELVVDAALDLLEMRTADFSGDMAALTY